MYKYWLLGIIFSLFLCVNIGFSEDFSHVKKNLSQTYSHQPSVNPSDTILINGQEVFFSNNAQLLCKNECRLDLECLLESYPGIITGVIADEQNRIWLVITGDKKVLYDDGKKRTYSEALSEGTVKDSMVQVYLLEPTRPIPGVDVAPGRVRSTNFLQAVYGDSENMVSKNLVPLEIQGEKFLFTETAGAAQALQRVSVRLDMLLQEKPQLIEYVLPFVDVFVWRPILGEKRLSPHSYGIAIDFNGTKGIYWKDTNDNALYLETQKTYPSELVRIFEENGFIWGGKWYEFDFQHFEYRPELICKAKKSAQ